eukprot:PhF_6_TR32373/c0_g1_i1/m.48013
MESKFDLSAIECCICMEVYTDPVTLTCGHSMCLSHTSRVTNCPMCRKTFQTAPAVSITLRDLIENLKHTCKACGDVVATSAVATHTCRVSTTPPPPPPSSRVSQDERVLHVDGEVISISNLQPSMGLNLLMEGKYPSGRKCKFGTQCTAGESCTSIHIVGVNEYRQCVTVDDRTYFVDNILPSRGLDALLNHEYASGRKCIFGSRCTDGPQCTSIHLIGENEYHLPVDDATYPVHLIQPSVGLYALLDGDRTHGRMCKYGLSCTKREECTAIHVLGVNAYPPTMVTVDSVLVGVKSLQQTKGLANLLSGRFSNGRKCCHGVNCTDGPSCTSIHFVGVNEYLIPVDGKRIPMSSIVATKGLETLLSGDHVMGRKCKFGALRCREGANCPYMHLR